jgi:hypothetical protein
MIKSRFVTYLLLVPLLLSAQPQFSGRAAAPASPDVVVDHFGYQMLETSSGSYDWKDATSGTKVYSLGFDDGHTAAIALPFVGGFDFYENNYTGIYINANGFIGFDASSIVPSQLYITNAEIPSEYETPQNIIAPYWDDVHGKGAPANTGVYYASGSDAQGQYFVIEWHNVLSYGSSTNTSETLTFEVVLYANGNILFQYKDLNATFHTGSTGIENSAGADGLGYLYNQALNGSDVFFTRPGEARRVEIFPNQLSSLNINRESAFKVQITNTGEVGADNYQLNLSSTDTSWEPKIYAADGITPLLDLDDDGKVETGSIDPGDTISVVVRVKAPNLTVLSDEVTVTLMATSELGALDPDHTELRSVIPSPFAITFREIKQGIKLGVFVESISAIGNYLTLTDQFPSGGNVFALSNATSPNYINVWQKSKVNQGGGTDYADIEYTMTDDFGYFLFQPTTRLLTNNINTSTRDLKPVVAVAQNGNLGVVWVRERTCDDGRKNFNVFLSILTPTANGLVLDRQNVTNHTACSQNGDADVMTLASPKIAATGNNFHLSWVENHYYELLDPPTQSYDIGHAVYTSSGLQVKAPALVQTFDPLDNLNYTGPALGMITTASTGEKVLLAYQVDNAGTVELNYISFNVDGSVFQPQTLLYGGEGFDIDLIQLSDGNVLFAWTDGETNEISFMLLRRSLTVLLPKTNLPSPDGRLGGSVSVSRDGYGNGILTWLDTTYYQRMYYALVDAGGVVTEPLAFKSAGAGGSYDTNPGYGSAGYIPRFRMLMPLTVK